MIRRHSQNLRPDKAEEREASILATRLKEAYERAKRERPSEAVEV